VPFLGVAARNNGGAGAAKMAYRSSLAYHRGSISNGMAAAAARWRQNSGSGRQASNGIVKAAAASGVKTYRRKRWAVAVENQRAIEQTYFAALAP